MSDRIAEIRTRLVAAGLTRPLRVDQHYDPLTTASFWSRVVELSEDRQSITEVVRTIPTEARWADKARLCCELIANAPADIKFLLGEVKRLRAALGDLVVDVEDDLPFPVPPDVEAALVGARDALGWEAIDVAGEGQG